MSKMTRERLSRLQAIQKEIDILKREIDYTTAEGAPYVTDVVTGSSSSFPYLKRRFTISGYDWDSYHAKLDKLNEKLKAKLNELLDEIDELLDFINTIDDSTLRMILWLKYVKGYTWEQIGSEIGYSARSVRMKHAKFIKNL